MRKKCEKQLPLMEPAPVHPKTAELEEIGKILDENPIIYHLAHQDLTHLVENQGSGACGMTAEQVVRATIIKQTEECSYEELAFLLGDSRCYGNFCKIGIGQTPFCKSTLASNIKSLSWETWEAIQRIVLKSGEKMGIEKGRKARIDCTVVESNIHEPTDSSLLWDTVRVLDRLIGRVREEFCDLGFYYRDHTRRAKRRNLGAQNAKDAETRKKAYRDLLKVTESTIGYAQAAVEELRSRGPLALGMVGELRKHISLGLRVVCQTTRRVMDGETVPAEEKVVSIFEPHADIIKKDRRDTYYGHKICLTGGASNLILDCVILEGNPADVTLTEQMLDRQHEIYGRYPLKVAMDGGFASKKNLKIAKGKGIKDVCFSKGKGLAAEDMCRSVWVFKALRRFRAGIESGISWLKRSLGLSRCTWKGHESFKSYVWSAIVSANLLTLARKRIALAQAG